MLVSQNEYNQNKKQRDLKMVFKPLKIATGKENVGIVKSLGKVLMIFSI